MPIRVFLGADHAGFQMKEALKAQLLAAGHRVEDLGCHSEERVDYPDYAAAVGRAVTADPGSFGVLVCGSGIGISIAANKIPGVRAALAHDETTARLSREHNDANILCLGARTTGGETASAALTVFLATPFAGGRHAGRVEKIGRLEQ